MAIISMMISVATLLIVVAALFWQESQYRQLKKKFDMAIVQSVMEHNPDIANKVVETHRQLYLRCGYTTAGAMREARRLHGLEP
jgi:hypothetical protein